MLFLICHEYEVLVDRYPAISLFLTANIRIFRNGFDINLENIRKKGIFATAW